MSKVLLIFFLCNCLLYGGEFTVLVNDTEGRPISDAYLKIGYTYGKDEKMDGHRVYTDSNGQFTFRADINWEFGVIARKDGYYETGKRFLAIKDVNGYAEPVSKKTVKLVLRRVEDPVSMYYGSIYEKIIPASGEFIAYDFLINDWLSPYGKGKESHVMFKYEKDVGTNKNEIVRVTVDFPNKGDGLIPFEMDLNEGSYSGSELQSDYFAPETGYTDSREWELRTNWHQITDKSLLDKKSSRTRGYYFRCNTILSDSGEVISANYGKIYSDLRCRPLKDGKGEITWAGYYYNPETNDRRVEFDRTRPLPDLLLDKQREDRAYLIRNGIEVDEGPLMLEGVRP